MPVNDNFPLNWFSELAREVGECADYERFYAVRAERILEDWRAAGYSCSAMIHSERIQPHA